MVLDSLCMQLIQKGKFIYLFIYLSIYLFIYLFDSAREILTLFVLSSNDSSGESAHIRRLA